MATKKYDLIVIGAGPGGYVAAIRAAQLGKNVACIEQEPLLGGTCLRVGCIPSKALLESSHRFDELKYRTKEYGLVVGDISFDLAAMMKRKDKIVKNLTGGIELLFKKNKIDRYLGKGRFDGLGKVVVENGEGEQTVLEADAIIIATGSRSADLPGVVIGGGVGTSTEALSWDEVPEQLVVIGAGFIGLELGSVWARLGAKVTVLEYMDRIMPGIDAKIADSARKILQRQGMKLRLGTKVVGAKDNGDGKCTVEVEGGDPIVADKVLVAVGRTPNTAGLGLESVGITVDRRGRIPVSEGWATTAPGIYAIGDVIGGVMLAHKAHEEGVACVERLYTGTGHVNYDAIPGVCYTSPEVASVGRTEEQLNEQGVAYKVGQFPFRANGRAITLGAAEGEVKILADAKTGRILGVHILGASAGDLIAEATAAIEFGVSAETLARTCHAHPTLAEAVREAALAALDRPIHM